MTQPAGETPVPTVSIPDIRDYERINAELVRALDEGHPRVRLTGAEGQRLLASGLTGAWQAVVEVEGRAGPELAAALSAPGLTVVCRGPAADGAGRSLRAGTLVILGDCGPALGYGMEGGSFLAWGDAGTRAGLNQRGGVIVVRGTLGQLAGERQQGGLFFAYDDRLGPHAGRGASGGHLVRLRPGEGGPEGGDETESEVLRNLLAAILPWIAPGGQALL
ncbi:MAG: glutamate synthase [Isosphaeraceae bacterium]|nr:glutamate synthase [Isosphaeraceae bacterium]